MLHCPEQHLKGAVQLQVVRFLYGQSLVRGKQCVRSVSGVGQEGGQTLKQENWDRGALTDAEQAEGENCVCHCSKVPVFITCVGLFSRFIKL